MEKSKQISVIKEGMNEGIVAISNMETKEIGEYFDFITDYNKYQNLLETVKELNEVKVKEFLDIVKTSGDKTSCEMALIASMINTHFRHQNRVGLGFIFNIDMLEQGLHWKPDKEGFISCLRSISKMSGVELNI